VAFCSYTGKAARVLREKLKEHDATYKQDQISTIHSLIYSPIINKKNEITGWKLKDNLEVDFIIIDEASMVNYKIWQDLLSYRKRILAVGDHGQLPPIHGSFNLMKDPELTLEQIHRQAKDNPIIKLSIMARKKGFIPIGQFSPSVVKINQQRAENAKIVNRLLADYDKDTMILCGYNFTRVELNKFVRNQIGHDKFAPVPGDRVICLRNNYDKNIFNGMTGTILELSPENDDFYFALIKMDGEEQPYEGLIHKKQFGEEKTLGSGYNKDNDKKSDTDDAKKEKFNDTKFLMKADLFDFGYAFTVHKAQGSQAKKVILFEQRFSHMDDNEWKKWLYTGITRAQEHLYIVGKPQETKQANY
jgi:ATP-dependent exoDNAse (exonuclease V) alpha subunit